VPAFLFAKVLLSERLYFELYVLACGFDPETLLFCTPLFVWFSLFGLFEAEAL
jgi:hypothetical protein